MPTGKQLTSKIVSLYFVSQGKCLVKRTGIEMELQEALCLIPDIRGWSLLRSVTSTHVTKPLGRDKSRMVPFPQRLSGRLTGIPSASAAVRYYHLTYQDAENPCNGRFLGFPALPSGELASRATQTPVPSAPKFFSAESEGPYLETLS